MSAALVLLNTIALFAEETEFDETAVTPGVLGFALTAVFALAVIFLGWDLVRRVRRAQNRALIGEELAEEIARRDAETRSGATSDDRRDADGGAANDTDRDRG